MQVDNLNLLKAAASRLATASVLINALYEALNEPEIDHERVVKLMSMDIAISTRLLRLANTASYNRGVTVTSVEKAIVWLGLSEAYRVTCATITAKLCEQNLPLYRISAGRLLYNSVATAVAMEMLAKEAELDPNTGYTLGLLANLGRLLLQRLADAHGLPACGADLPQIAQVLAWERTHLGWNQAEAGALILRHWGLNPVFAGVIACQYDIALAGDATSRRWSALFQVAKTLVAITDYSLGVESDSCVVTDAIMQEADLPNFDGLLFSAKIATATRELCADTGVPDPWVRTAGLVA